jgi:hypothetical protein
MFLPNTLLSAKFWGSQQGWPWKYTAVCCGNAHAPVHFSDFHAMDLAYWHDISHPVLLHFRGNARISEAAWVIDLAESRA